MSFKITKREDAVPYEAKGHYGMLATRLHNPADVNDGSMTQGLSHFLPGGGCEYGANALESIYYIVEGEMDIVVEEDTPEEVRTTLHKGDSFHCGPNTRKGIKNNGPVTCQMLVTLVRPEAR